MTLLQELAFAAEYSSIEQYSAGLREAAEKLRAFADKLEGEEAIEKVNRALINFKFEDDEDGTCREYTCRDVAKTVLAVVREMICEK